MKASEGRHPGGGVTTTPRGVLKKGFSKCTNESPASSCSAPRTGSAWLAVKRALRAESAAAAATEEPWPRSSVKVWAKVWLFSAPEDRSLSLITTWDAPASCRAEARLPASPCENVDAVSTQGPASGLRPAARSTWSPRSIWAPISLAMPASESATRLMGTYGWSSTWSPLSAANWSSVCSPTWERAARACPQPGG